MSNWKALFASKYKDHDSFMFFYSKSKSTIHKLKRSNSIAVTDEVFLRYSSPKPISADKLQGETKKLPMSGSKNFRFKKVYRG